MNNPKNYFLSQKYNYQQAAKLSKHLDYKCLDHSYFNQWDKKLSNTHCNNNKKPTFNSETQDKEKDIPNSQIEHGATILMIDDEDVYLYSMEIILMGTPYSLITLNKSTEALEYIYANIDNIDLIFLDLNMPEMNGLELLEKIKNDRMLASIPVILQSACTDESEIKKAYILDITSFLHKPYDKSQVLYAIKKALNKK